MPVRDVPLTALHTLVGEDLGVSDWTDMTQARIQAFADATGDDHWFHLDIPRASRELGGAVAQGLLTLAMLFMMRAQTINVTGYSRNWNYGFDRLRFTHPVHAGDRIRLRQRLLSVTPKGEGLLVRVGVTIEIENKDKPAIVAEHLTVYYQSD